MSEELNALEKKEKNIPEGLSFVRVNKKTGKIDSLENDNTYFELFLDENIED
jgi:membrane carboxypeptidase/penicillin-binding protein